MNLEIQSLAEGGVRLRPKGGVRLRPEAGGPDALILHGYGGSHRDVLPLALELARAGHAVTAPDLPGHGQNPQSLSIATLEGWARGHTLAEDVGQGRLVLGHSLGARLAWKIARPGDRVVSISPPLSGGFPPELRKELLSVLRPRWVRESRPMVGLLEAVEALPGSAPAGSRQLLLLAAQDLPSVEESWTLLESDPSVERDRLAHTDHRSILLHPLLAQRILRWIAT